MQHASLARSDHFAAPAPASFPWFLALAVPGAALVAAYGGGMFVVLLLAVGLALAFIDRLEAAGRSVSRVPLVHRFWDGGALRHEADRSAGVAPRRSGLDGGSLELHRTWSWR